MSGIEPERDQRGVVTLWLSNPGRRNALSNAMVEGLCEAMRGLAEDETCRAIVLRGRDGVFCAGRDLHDLGALQGAPGAAVERMYDLMEEMNRLIHFSPKPVVAVVERYAFGIAAMIAGWADIAIAEESAVFSYPEARHGIVPYGAVPTLLATMPRRAVADVLLTGRRIGASEAVRLGIVTRTAAAGEIETALEAALAELLAGKASAIAGIKAFMRECGELGYDEGIRLATARAKAGTGAAAAREGIGHFLGKREAGPAAANDQENERTP